MTTKSAKKTFSLDKSYRRGTIDNRRIFAHKSNDLKIIGVTFYRRVYEENPKANLKEASNSREKYISEFETKYNLKFKPLNIKNLSFPNPDFVYMELSNGVIVVVVGSMYYNLTYNTYTSISFFQGIGAEKLDAYLQLLY